MKRHWAAVAACILLASGCRMCSDCCDYSSPVADSPYHNPYGRAGSAFTGTQGYAATPLPMAAETPADEGASAMPLSDDYAE